MEPRKLNADNSAAVTGNGLPPSSDGALIANHVPETFSAFRIHGEVEGRWVSGIEHVTLQALSPGDVVIRAEYSSVNYKDALAGTGKGKILRKYPLIGGIDVAGTVVSSEDARFKAGDQVIVTGCGQSETRDGGYSHYVRANADHVIALPNGLNTREAMILGTAGFTAALSLLRMERLGQRPEQGPIVVTGATGGVGMLGIDILTRAGYEAHAITGKLEQLDFLTTLGARQVISRDKLFWGQRPLESVMWAGALDGVGGEMLEGLSRVIGHEGTIASYGMAGGSELHTTVMPFILRSVSIIGVSSSNAGRNDREAVWQKLAGPWRPAHLEKICSREATLDELPEIFNAMLRGETFGRTLIRI